MKKVYNYDVVVLGGGPAGLSASIYLARANLKVAIVDTSMLGGQPSNYLELDNYPGFKLVGGYELMEKFLNHSLSLGVDKYEMQEIVAIDLLSTTKKVVTKDSEFHSKSIIIATGASPKRLGLENELEYVGRGVSYCAICDAGFYKDKIVTVVGGGNSAIEEAIYLSKFAKKVNLVHRRNEFRADKILQDKLFSNDKIEVFYNSSIVQIVTKDRVEAIVLKDVLDNSISELQTDGLFVYVGIEPNVKLFGNQLLLDNNGFIETNSEMQTSVEGVYAIGDVRNTPLRQVITSASDGAIAAVYCSKYIDSLQTAKK